MTSRGQFGGNSPIPLMTQYTLFPAVSSAGGQLSMLSIVMGTISTFLLPKRYAFSASAGKEALPVPGDPIA